MSRKKDEVICIGGDIEIMVVAVIGKKVRLGVQAPKGVSIDRKEVRQKKQKSPPLGGYLDRNA